MLKRFVLVAASIFALGTTAFASQCPASMAEIDEALQTAQLTAEDSARVAELRQTGDELHQAGDHAGSIEALEEAREILGLDQ